MIELSVFRNFWDTTPAAGTLEAMVEAIRTDARTRELTLGYRQQRRDLLKNESMMFAVACRFAGGKAAANVASLTGLAMVDFDHIAADDDANANANETSPTPRQESLPSGRLGGGPSLSALRQKLVADPHTLLCYTTISGRGLRVLYRYELDAARELRQQVQFYRKAFATGNAYYARLAGAPTDEKCKNVTRLTAVAHDPDVYFNAAAEAFTAAWIEDEWQSAVEAGQRRKRRERELRRIEACYEQTLRREVEAEGAVYAAGSHNDYVMRVGYRLNQFGFSEEAAVAWAATAFPDYEKAADVVRSCYGRTEEHATRSTRPSRRSSGAQGAPPCAGVEDIQAFLKDHIRLRHNVITGRVEYAAAPTDGAGGGTWQPITDRVVNSLWAAMSREQRVNVQDVYRVVESDFVADFQPFADYLGALPAPEGDAGAIHALAATVRVRGGAEEQALWEEYLRKWLVGMVAAWVDDAVVNNVILVLIGEQGSYKTTWFNYLLPPALRRYFYTKTNANRMGRDDLLTLAQYGLICCEELDTMRPSELNQLKAAVTMPSIDERAAYAHFHEHRKHIASFCGTGNNTQFLGDPTGNRRWLPFEVESICSPREQPFDHDAVFAEAYALYRRGFAFWFSREEIVRLSDHNRRFETPRLELELVQQYFRVPTEGERGEFISVAHALQIIGGGLTQKLSPVYIGRAFRELGFAQRRVLHVRGYVVVRYTAEEMQARRQLAAQS